MKYKVLKVLFFLTLIQMDFAKAVVVQDSTLEADYEDAECEEFEEEDFWQNGNGALNEIAFEMRNQHHEHHNITLQDKLYYLVLLMKYFFIQMPRETSRKYWLYTIAYLGLKKQKQDENKTKQCT